MADNNDLVNRVWLILTGSVDSTASKLPEEAKKLLDAISKPAQASLAAFQLSAKGIIQSMGTATDASAKAAASSLRFLVTQVEASQQALSAFNVQMKKDEAEVEKRLGKTRAGNYGQKLVEHGVLTSQNGTLASLVGRGAELQRQRNNMGPETSARKIHSQEAQIELNKSKQLQLKVLEKAIAGYELSLPPDLVNRFKHAFSASARATLVDALKTAEHNLKLETQKANPILKKYGIKSPTSMTDKFEANLATNRAAATTRPGGMNVGDVASLERMAAAFMNATQKASVALHEVKQELGASHPIVLAMEKAMAETAKHISDELEERRKIVGLTQKEAAELKAQVQEEEERKKAARELVAQKKVDAREEKAELQQLATAARKKEAEDKKAQADNLKYHATLAAAEEKELARVAAAQAKEEARLKRMNDLVNNRQSAAERTVAVTAQTGEGKHTQGEVTSLLRQYETWKEAAKQIEAYTASTKDKLGNVSAEAKTLEARYDAVGKYIKNNLEIAQQAVLSDTRQAELTKSREEKLKRIENGEKEILALKVKQEHLEEQISHKRPDAKGNQVLTGKELGNLANNIGDVTRKMKNLDEEIAKAGSNAEPLRILQTGFKNIRGEMEKTYNDHKKLRDEFNSQLGKGSFDGFIKGLRGGSLRSAGALAAKTFKEGFDGAGGGGKGFLSGLSGAASFGGGYLALAAPLALLKGGFGLAQKAAGEFFNILQTGGRTLLGFIQQAAEMQQAVIQFSLATGMAIEASSKIVGVFKTLGLDTQWTAVGLDSLGKEVIKNNKIFTNMGIATRTASGDIRDMNDVLADLRERYQSLSEQGKVNMLGDLRTAIPFISMMTPFITSDFDKITETLKKLNVVMNETDRQKLTNVNAAMATLRMTGQGLANTIGAALAPALTNLANTVAAAFMMALPQIQGFFDKVGGWISDFISNASGIKGNDIVSDVGSAMAKGMADGTKNAKAYQDQVQAAADSTKGLQEEVDLLNASLEKQSDVLTDLNNKQAAEIEIINDKRDAAQKALDKVLDPLEKENRLLEAQKRAWNDLKAAAVEALDDQLKGLNRANAAIDRGLKAATKPLKDQLKALQRSKKSNSLGAKHASEDIKDNKETDAATNASIKAANKAWKDNMDRQINQLQAEKRAVDALIKAVKTASDTWERQQKIVKDGLNVQIQGIQTLMTMSQKASKEQEYQDQRAYLMGQTLLAQAEARERSLADRASRQRNGGESDVDYQLRMQQLNAAADTASAQQQQALSMLDQQHALEGANDALQHQIDLIQEQMAQIDVLIAKRKEADDIEINGFELQKDAIELQIQALQDLKSARQDVASVSTDNSALDAQKDSASADNEEIDSQGQALQDQIDALEEKAQAEKDINDDKITALEILKESAIDYYDAQIKPIQHVIDKNQDLIAEYKYTHELLVRQLKEEQEAVTDRYKPQILAQKAIVEGLQDEVKEKQRLIREIQRELAHKEALYEKEKARIKLATTTHKVGMGDAEGTMDVDNGSGPTNKKDDNSVGGRLGTWVNEVFVAPFKDKGFSDGLKQSMKLLWKDLEPLLADLARDILKALFAGMVSWIKSHPAETAMLAYGIVLGIALAMAIGPIGVLIGLLVGTLLALFKDSIAEWMSNHKLLIAGLLLAFMPTLIILIDKWIWDHKSELFDKFKEFFGEILHAGKEVLEKIGEWLYDNIIQPIIDFVKEWGKLEDTWSDFWREVLTAGAKIFEKIGEFIYDWIIKPIIDLIGDGAKGTLEVAGAAFDFFGGILDSGVDAFKDMSKWLWQHIGNPILDFFEDIPEKVGNAFGWIADKVAEPFKAIVRGVKWVFDTIAKPINSILDFVGIREIPTFGGSDPGGAWYVAQGNSPNKAVRKFADGGRVDSPTHALIGEGGFPEYVLSTDPNKAMRNKALLSSYFKETGKNGGGGWWDDLLDAGGSIWDQVKDSANWLGGNAKKFFELPKYAAKYAIEELMAKVTNGVMAASGMTGGAMNSTAGRMMQGIPQTMGHKIVSMFANGGFIKPNSTILDASGNPYAVAGHGSEMVTPMNFLRTAVNQSVASAIRPVPGVTNNSSSSSGVVWNGDLVVNSNSSDPVAVAKEARTAVGEFFKEMAAHSGPARMGGVR